MKTAPTLLLLAVLAVACSSTPIESIVAPTAMVGLQVVVQEDFGPGRGTLTEWIPEGESLDDWTRRARIEFLEGSALTPDDLAERRRAELLDRCPAALFDVLHADLESVVFEWSVALCDGEPDAHSVVRVFQGNDGLHRIDFTHRGGRMAPDLRERWLRVLARSYVAKGRPGNPIELQP